MQRFTCAAHVGPTLAQVVADQLASVEVEVSKISAECVYAVAEGNTAEDAATALTQKARYGGKLYWITFYPVTTKPEGV
jgi:hypothetical protein